MSKIIVVGLLSMCFSINSMGQSKILTLDEAITGAEINYPSIKQKRLLEEAGKENQKSLSGELYPQVIATGQATYQSEVTAIELPGFAGQKPDNYNIGLDMRFPLTQFGTVETKKELEKAQTDLSITQLDVDIQRVRERVTTIFGNVLLQTENENILGLRITDLDSQRKKVAVGVASGAVLKMNQLVLESEILSSQQRIDDIRATKKGMVSQLSLLTGLPIDTATQFQLSSVSIKSGPVNRSELKSFEAQKRIFDIRSDLIKKEARPNIYLFGQGYYGRPGYNFLNIDLRTYGIAGLGLHWNLNNVFTHSEQRILEINKNIISQQEETFRLNLQASLSEKQAEIDKYQSIISKDAQIVQKRQEILRAAASQLENGVITSTEYLTELNAQSTAQLNLVLHHVQLSIAKAQYNTLSGY